VSCIFGLLHALLYDREAHQDRDDPEEAQHQEDSLLNSESLQNFHVDFARRTAVT
jgi:hypothetical protein